MRAKKEVERARVVANSIFFFFFAKDSIQAFPRLEEFVFWRKFTWRGIETCVESSKDTRIRRRQRGKRHASGGGKGWRCLIGLSPFFSSIGQLSSKTKFKPFVPERRELKLLGLLLDCCSARGAAC